MLRNINVYERKLVEIYYVIYLHVCYVIGNNEAVSIEIIFTLSKKKTHMKRIQR